MDSRYVAVSTVIPEVVIKAEDDPGGGGGGGGSDREEDNDDAAGERETRRSSVFTITSAIKEFPDYIKRESRKVRGKEESLQ